MKKIIQKGKVKGTIIFIHGNSSSSAVFEQIIEADEILQTKIAIDLPGHGKSIREYKYHTDFSVQFYKDQLIELINNINDEIILVGNSLGGHLAIEIAQSITNLKGLVIFGTPPVKKPINFEEAFLPVEALQTFLTEIPSSQEIETAAEIAVFDNEHSTNIIVDFKKTNPLVRKCIAEDILGGKLSNEFEIFTKLKIPKFIIVGEEDPSVNSNYLVNVKNVCKDNCTIIPFKNCGHYPSLEKPQEFLKTLQTITEKVF
ncbi:alpha/beta fold hydrolase [Polaribacter septentrionalilitoris]|uniref:alpha/beta fold hydrolase n=1 Tax=Polaribacter septentrionalilitoris TaxID=2494657 RepID=UPI00135CCE3B|nr:alpha/beta hydrolase [Polaribacter septentrionalilitoris]